MGSATGAASVSPGSPVDGSSSRSPSSSSSLLDDVVGAVAAGMVPGAVGAGSDGASVADDICGTSDELTAVASIAVASIVAGDAAPAEVEPSALDVIAGAAATATSPSVVPVTSSSPWDTAGGGAGA